VFEIIKAIIKNVRAQGYDLMLKVACKKLFNILLNRKFQVNSNY